MKSFIHILRSRILPHILIVPCFLLLALLVPSSLCAADFDKGLRAAEAGDYAAAFAEWRPLAEQGLAGAQYNLGHMYYKGEVVPQDDAEAAKWYRRAAEQGVVEAQVNIGVMYAMGESVPKDYVLAHMWGNLARAQGMKRADKLLELLEPRMSYQQIAKARTLARKCEAQNYKNCDKL